MRTSTRFRLAYLVIAVIDAILAGSTSKGAHRARWLTKPLLMPTLVAALATDEKAKDSPLRTSTMAGLSAGWVGDVALLNHSEDAMLVGTGAFAVGHGAYSSGFLTHQDPARPAHSRGIVRAIAGTWLMSAPMMARSAWKKDRRLGVSTATYSTLLSGTVAAAQNLDPALPRRARLSIAAGTGLFMASDSLLGSTQFMFKDAPARLESVVMATYTAGQYLIADGAAHA